MKVDQAGRPLPPIALSILVGLTLKLGSLCILRSGIRVSHEISRLHDFVTSTPFEENPLIILKIFIK